MNPTIFKPLTDIPVPIVCDECNEEISPSSEGMVYFVTRPNKSEAPEYGTIRHRRCPSKVQSCMSLEEFASLAVPSTFATAKDETGFASLSSRLESEADFDPNSLDYRVKVLETKVKLMTRDIESLRFRS